MVRLQVLVLACGLLCAAPASAEDPAVAAVAASFQSLDYLRAIEGARRLLKRGGNSPDDLRTLLAVLGQSLAAVGKAPEATPIFQKLLVLAPGFQLPAEASPKIRAPLEQVRRDWRGKSGLPVAHVPPRVARPDRQLNLLVQVERNPLQLVDGARMYYRLPGAHADSELSLRAGRGLVVFSLALPALGAQAGTLNYWIELLDKDRNILIREGLPNRPLSLQLDRTAPAPAPAVAVAQETQETSRPWYRRWWVWTVCGVVLTGATVGIIAGTASHKPDLEVGWSIKTP